MRKNIISSLLVLGMVTSCGTSPKQPLSVTCQAFEGDYVTSEYNQRAEGYDWTVVSITSLSDTVANISVKSRTDIKKPTCSFEGTGHITPSGDTLVSTFDNNEIYFVLTGDTLSVSSDSPNLLYYFCSGGASLGGQYIKLHEPLDDTMLKKNFNGQKLSYPGSKISYTIHIADDNLLIVPNGLTVVNDTLKHDLTGYTIANIETGDLNGDTFPELFIYLVSDGSGSYGKLIGYSPNNGKSLSQVYLPEIAENTVYGKGYMGHDEMAIVESSFCQRFPVYAEKDSNARPSGKIRQIQYKMMNGEAGRSLKIDKVIEY